MKEDGEEESRGSQPATQQVVESEVRERQVERQKPRRKRQTEEFKESCLEINQTKKKPQCVCYLETG